MKKTLSIIMSILMLAGMMTLFAAPVMAGGSEPVPETTFKMYVSDSGSDANDGLTATTPKKTLNGCINYFVTIMPKPDAKTAEIILVGDVTINDSTKLGNYEKCPLIITSADKENNKLIIKNNFRISGETLFTNIKIIYGITDTNKGLWADGYKLTLGKENTPNDIVTYDQTAGSAAPLNVIGAAPNANKAKKVDVTINSGTYKFVQTGAGQYGDTVKGDINFVINDATITDGIITVGGGIKNVTSFAPQDGTRLEGVDNYNVVINNGTFTNTNIVIGSAASGKKNEISGSTVIDINGGTFTNCQIGLGTTFKSDMPGTISFKDITVDFVSIPNANKETYASMVKTSDITTTNEDNKITVLRHSYTKFVDVDENTHKASCECGCTNVDVVLDHEFDEGTITTHPNHTTPGEKLLTCTQCKRTKNAVIQPDATTHDYSDGWVKVDDAKHQKVCKDPGCPDANKGAIAEDHKFDEGVIKEEATHIKEGSKEYTCADCGYVKVEAIKKIEAHSMGEWEKHDADKHKRSCECGEAKYGDHDWDDGKVTVEATADAEGEKIYTCSICGETKTEAIAKLGGAEDDGGCGSSVGVGVAVVAISSVMAVVFMPKKKEN